MGWERPQRLVRTPRHLWGPEEAKLGWPAMHSLCVAEANLVAGKSRAWGDRISMGAGDLWLQSPCRSQLGPSVPKKDGRCCRGDNRGAPLPWRQTERAGVAQPGEGKGPGRP